MKQHKIILDTMYCDTENACTECVSPPEVESSPFIHSTTTDVVHSPTTNQSIDVIKQISLLVYEFTSIKSVYKCAP